MSNTSQFELPLIAEGQAQKHITVNEALARLDALAQLRLKSRALAVAPNDPIDGDCYFVPVGALGLWADKTTKLVFWSNGGWLALAPKVGWQAWIEDEGRALRFDGADWVIDAPNEPELSHLTVQALDIVQPISNASEVNTSSVIPANSWVLSVAHRVTQEIVTDGPTGWLLGHAGDKDQWGSGKGLALNDSGFGGTGKRMFFFGEDTPICLSVNNGQFLSGEVALRVYLFTLTPPDVI